MQVRPVFSQSVRRPLAAGTASPDEPAQQLDQLVSAPLPAPARWKQNAVAPLGQLARRGLCAGVGLVGMALGGGLGIVPGVVVKIGDLMGVQGQYYTERERNRSSLFRFGNYLQFVGAGALAGHAAGPVGTALGAVGGALAGRLWLHLGDRFSTSYNGHFPASGNWNTAQAIGDRGSLLSSPWTGLREGANLGRRSVQELCFPTRFASGWEQHDGARPQVPPATRAPLKELVRGDYGRSVTQALEQQRTPGNARLLDPLLAALEAGPAVDRSQGCVLTALVNHYRANAFAYIEHFHSVLQKAPTPLEAEVLELLPGLAGENKGTVRMDFIHSVPVSGKAEDEGFRRILAGNVPTRQLELARAILHTRWGAAERSQGASLALSRQMSPKQALELRKLVEGTQYEVVNTLRSRLENNPLLPAPEADPLPPLPPVADASTAPASPAAPPTGTPVFATRPGLRGEVIPGKLEYSADGRYLAVGRPGEFAIKDKKPVPQVEYWDLSRGQRVPPDDPELARRAADKLVRTTDKGEVFLWDVPTNTVQQLHGHKERISAHAFSPLGGLLVTSAWDGTVRLWNTETGHELRRMPIYLWAERLQFSQDGRELVVGGHDGQVSFVDMATFEPVRCVKDGARAAWGSLDGLTFSGDGQRMIVARHEETDYPRPAEWDHEIRFVDPQSMQVQGKIALPDGVRDMAVSPDGRFLAAALPDRIQIYNLAGTSAGTASLPDSNFLASALADPNFRGDLKILRDELPLPTQAHVTGLCFSPDTGELVAGLGDGQILRWDTSSAASSIQETSQHVVLAGVVVKRKGAFRA